MFCLIYLIDTLLEEARPRGFHVRKGKIGLIGALSVLELRQHGICAVRIPTIPNHYTFLALARLLEA